MKKGFIILQLLIFLVFFSCSDKFETSELKEHFTAEQINDLEALTNFFIKQLCFEKKSSFKECYKSALPKLVEEGWNPIMKRIDFVKQKEIYKEIMDSTFSEIWIFCELTECCPEIEYKSLCPNMNGKFLSFIQEISKSNIIVKKYTQRLIDSGDYDTMGFLQHEIFQNPRDFDLDDPNLQVILTVNYLGQNDQQKRGKE